MINSTVMNKYARGFTLIELMIVVAILGILYSIAMPAYTEYMERGRRADMQHHLLQMVAVLERNYSRMGAYPDAYDLPDFEYYTLNYAPQNRGDNTQFTSKSFVLSATPKDVQAGDRCGVLSVDEVGQQLASGGANCWG